MSAQMAMELGAHRWGFNYITYPELPSDADPMERGRLLRDAVLYSGVKMTLHTSSRRRPLKLSIKAFSTGFRAG
jgi:hypothetical protein